ncbi:hypothetical protein L6452_43450 [Arctium lappa]|uniref:Uncharacterized protein n=1 Tax=Arctium lappa TaxID=4217 RepID=A0ACB8XE47_ARCLA|nr:hypothetical protein L6452_43450 [Arctium lappa]
MYILKSHWIKDDELNSKVLSVENSVKGITIDMGNLSRQSDSNQIKESLKSIYSKIDSQEGILREILRKIPSTPPGTSRSLTDIPLNVIPEFDRELIYITERRTVIISEQIHHLTAIVDHALFHPGASKGEKSMDSSYSTNTGSEYQSSLDSLISERSRVRANQSCRRCGSRKHHHIYLGSHSRKRNPISSL